jgi:hypothetical protein
MNINNKKQVAQLFNDYLLERSAEKLAAIKCIKKIGAELEAFRSKKRIGHKPALRRAKFIRNGCPQ